MTTNNGSNKANNDTRNGLIFLGVVTMALLFVGDATDSLRLIGCGSSDSSKDKTSLKVLFQNNRISSAEKINLAQDFIDNKVKVSPEIAAYCAFSAGEQILNAMNKIMLHSQYFGANRRIGKFKNKYKLSEEEFKELKSAIDPRNKLFHGKICNELELRSAIKTVLKYINITKNRTKVIKK